MEAILDMLKGRRWSNHPLSYLIMSYDEEVHTFEIGDSGPKLHYWDQIRDLVSHLYDQRWNRFYEPMYDRLGSS